MYGEHWHWLTLYQLCLYSYASGRYADAEGYDFLARESTPPFLTDELCDQHKRRLYTKAPDLYPQFAPYGKSEENWYVVDGQLVKYANGKRI